MTAKRFFTLSILAIVSISFITLTGCAVGKQNGYGAPKLQVPTAAADTGINGVAVATKAPVVKSDPKLDALLEGQTTTNKILGYIAKNLNGKQEEPAQTGKPGPYANRANSKKLDAPDSPKEVKIVNKGVSWAEHNKLKDRVAALEDMSDGKKDTARVNFKPGDITLSTDDKAYLKRLADRWFNGEVSIVKGKGHASKAKAKGEISNEEYARLRLNEAAVYLRAEGVEISVDQLEVVGETDRYSNDCNVVWVLEKITDAEEIKKLKEGRAPKRKMPPMPKAD